jgi:hypothetical protein
MSGRVVPASAVARDLSMPSDQVRGHAIPVCASVFAEFDPHALRVDVRINHAHLQRKSADDGALDRVASGFAVELGDLRDSCTMVMFPLVPCLSLAEVNSMPSDIAEKWPSVIGPNSRRFSGPSWLRMTGSGNGSAARANVPALTFLASTSFETLYLAVGALHEGLMGFGGHRQMQLDALAQGLVDQEFERVLAGAPDLVEQGLIDDKILPVDVRIGIVGRDGDVERRRFFWAMRAS